MKKKLLVSFSGGRTSGYMLWWLFNKWEDRHNWEMIVVFANTGKESSETLVFVHKCSWRWNIPIVWVEAKHVNGNGEMLSEKGWSVSHNVVDYFTASRKGEPFEEMIKNLGIPTTNAPFCSDQLKRKAIESYLKSIGWSKYYKAIGIRSDELDRVNENYKEKRIFYPFAFLEPTIKSEIIEWWENQDFDLEVNEGFGNCDNCWKKDMITLCRNAREKPESLKWWQDMTDIYGSLNPRGTELNPPFNFYRGNLSPKDILKLSMLPDNKIIKMAKREYLDSCSSESCEAF